MIKSLGMNQASKCIFPSPVNRCAHNPDQFGGGSGGSFDKASLAIVSSPMSFLRDSISFVSVLTTLSLAV